MTIEALEQRVETLEREMKALADILTMDRRITESRLAAVLADLDLIKRRLDEMPSAVARTVIELLDERDNRRR
jgi:chromosome segregation ATPase